MKLVSPVVQIEYVSGEVTMIATALGASCALASTAADPIASRPSATLRICNFDILHMHSAS